MGCCLNMSLACRSPVTMTPTPAMIITTAPKRSAVRYIGNVGVVLVGASLLDQPERADARDEPACDEERRGDHVRERDESRVVAEHRQMFVISARPVSGLYVVPTGCCIHEFAAMMKYARDVGADREEPHGREVDLLRQAVPAEDPQAKERRLEEERDERLHRERRAEDVADVARVFGPVHAELELLHDAGRDAEREVDEQQLAVELRESQPLLLAGSHPRGLHDRDQDRQAEGERDENEVVDGRDAELPTREF